MSMAEPEGTARADELLRRWRKAKESRTTWEGHWRFSCWNRDDPNRPKLERVDERDPVFALCREVAAAALAGRLSDPTGGATHYHVRGLTPWWARGLEPCARIGAHLFYRGVD